MAEGRPTKLPFLKEIRRAHKGQRKRTDTNSSHQSSSRGGSRRTTSSPVRTSFALSSQQTPLSDTIPDFMSRQDSVYPDEGGSILKVGDLIKTSRSRRNNQTYGPSRKRRFRVTEEALEYFQPFSHLKIKKSFPITSIVEVNILHDRPATFEIFFKNFAIELEASSPTEAQEWVDVIQRCVCDWKDDDPFMSIDRQRSLDDTFEDRRPRPLSIPLSIHGEDDEENLSSSKRDSLPRVHLGDGLPRHIDSLAGKRESYPPRQSEGMVTRLRDNYLRQVESCPGDQHGSPRHTCTDCSTRPVHSHPSSPVYSPDISPSTPPPQKGPTHPLEYDIRPGLDSPHPPEQPATPTDDILPPLPDSVSNRGSYIEHQRGVTTPKGGVSPVVSPTQSDKHSVVSEPNYPTMEKPKVREIPARSFTPSGNRVRSRSLGILLNTYSVDEGFTLERTTKRKSIRKKLRLVPKLEKHAPVIQKKTGQQDEDEEGEHWKVLHDEFAMIKYPRRQWASLPTEKIFKLDKDNLQIMWKNTGSSKTKYSSILRLDSILEIRLGQQTDGFQKFPYDEVADQSFSLIYEDVNGKYARLGSLDLICDHPIHFSEWLDGLTSLQIGPVSAMFPSRYENTDPVLIWLKRFWSCFSVNHEMSRRDAIKLTKAINPTISTHILKDALSTAHNHQHEASYSNVHSLRWDGFVLLYNLLAGETGRLYGVFREYAKTYKRLGLTVDEFKHFLMQECYYKEEDCQKRRLKELMAFHDHHHWAFKKFAGKNKPSNWKISKKLLSYAGFLSFIRSKHNAAVSPQHDTVCQDMDQPLSHYFINSSHNTYLEADQIKGRSTLDAYVRALVQGARCVEIDCWDNTIGKDEPIIYHGFTFTSKLPLRDVIRTINKYAFHMSHYPVIISIENHCNPQQQAKMAEIFNEEFRNELGQCIVATENLVEGEDRCRARLPSPTELQGMILLKGSYKNKNHQGPTMKKAISKQISGLISPPARRTSVDESKSTLKNDIPETSPTGKGEWAWPEPDDDITKPINKGSRVITRGRTRREARSFTARVKENEGNVETPEDDQELTYTETAKTLSDMIVYCRSTRIRPWSWKVQEDTSICQMFSFGEISATNHYKKSSKELLACTERQFVRTYPKGARIDSSNYNPVPFWNHGIQMVALNFQTPDLYMHLNQGVFRQNGGCGYVLKPKILRTPNPGSDNNGFNPLTMKTPHPDIPTCPLYIELMSGQNLTIFGKDCLSVSVQISTYGIEADTHSNELTAVSNDAFAPNWPAMAKTFSHLILMPELCLVYFRVDITLKTAGRSVTQLFGQNCIALPSLQPGIKFIQLRKAGGELIPESGLFVTIKMGDRPSTAEDSRPHLPSMDVETTPTASNHSMHKIGLVHQDGIDISKSPIRIPTPPGNEMTESIEIRDATPIKSEEYDDHSMVNLLDIDPVEPDGVPISNMEVDLYVEETGPDTETQTATLEVTAEIY